MARAIDQLFGMGFVPEQLIADNGSEFKNKDVAAVLERWNVVMIHSRPHHPQTNGTVESSNKTFKQRLRALRAENAHRPWWDLMQLASCTYALSPACGCSV